MIRLSYSAITEFQTCPRKYYYSSVLKRGARGSMGRALGFGLAFHEAQAVLWEGGDDRLDKARARWSEAAAREALSFEDTLLGEVLLLGYSLRWDDFRLNYQGAPLVERRVTVPVLDLQGNPDPELELVCVFDVVAMDMDGTTVPVEHKTTTSPIDPGAPYWQRLEMNLQASIYYIVAGDAGRPVNHILWDVIKAPRLERLLATPVERREFYTRPPKGKSAGDPKPGTRLVDETADEFAARVMDQILTDPAGYFQRQAIYRSEDEIARVRADIWMTGQSMLHSLRTGAYPRNLDSCQKFNRPCPYLPVCTGQTDIEDERVYTIRRRNDAAGNEGLWK